MPRIMVSIFQDRHSWKLVTSKKLNISTNEYPVFHLG